MVKQGAEVRTREAGGRTRGDVRIRAGGRVRGRARTQTREVALWRNLWNCSCAPGREVGPIE